MFGLVKEECGRDDPENPPSLMIVGAPFLLLTVLVLHCTFEIQLRILAQYITS